MMLHRANPVAYLLGFCRKPRTASECHGMSSVVRRIMSTASISEQIPKP